MTEVETDRTSMTGRRTIEDRFLLPDIALALDRQGDFHARAKTLIDVEGAF